MSWDADAYIRLLDETPAQQLRRHRRPAIRLVAPKALAWKTVLLAVTTIAFVPVILWQHRLAAGLYVGALVLVHVIGLAAMFAGRHLWADRRTLAWRLGGIGVLAVLLSFVGKGLTTTTGAVFWTVLGLVWLLHSAGAVLFHLRGDPRACPFV